MSSRYSKRMPIGEVRELLVKSIAMFTKLDGNTVYLQTSWTEARKLAAWAAREVWNNLRDQGFQPVNEFDRVKCCKAA